MSLSWTESVYATTSTTRFFIVQRHGPILSKMDSAALHNM